jgi:hypothetical protein
MWHKLSAALVIPIHINVVGSADLHEAERRRHPRRRAVIIALPFQPSDLSCHLSAKTFRISVATAQKQG